MASSVGWRNFWWLNVGIHGFVFFAVLFGFPETRWHRVPSSGPNTEIRVSGYPSKEYIVELQPEPKGPGFAKVARRSATAENLRAAETTNTDSNVHLGKSKPSRRQWWLLQPEEYYLNSLIYAFLLPWRLLCYPIVLFASFVVSFSSTCYLLITFVQSEALGEKPYNFSSQTVGFTNFACLAGAIIGLFTAGPASDLVSAALTKRNNGIREPEMRLVTMIPYVLIMMLGNFIVAFGLQHLWDWKVSCAVYLSHGSTNHKMLVDRHPWFHLHRYTSHRSSVNCVYLRRRFLQTRGWRHLHLDHRKQKPLGLRRVAIHHVMGAKRRLYPSIHDEHGLDRSVV